VLFLKIDLQEKLQAAGHWNAAYLSQHHPEITESVVTAYRDYARFKFDCGDYESARTLLTNYIALAAHPPATSNASNNPDDADDDELAGMSHHQQQNRNKEKDGNTGNASMYYLLACDSNMLHVLWGRLACEILVLDWPAAAKAVEAVKTALESMAAAQQLSSLQALQQRTWLLHWSLFVYWNVDRGLEQLVDLFFSEKYKQAVTTVAPHLLRYLTAAVLLCKRRDKAVASAEARKLVKMLVYVMQDCEYTDPIVEFVNCLCVKFDFDSAQQKLAVCEKVLAADFFLCHQTALFMEEARVFVFENYCRIHNKIDLKALGEKLAMDQEQAERWIVDLIRNADLDAKIDSTAGCVVMGDGNPQTMYEQVVERTRDLNVRTATLTQNLANVLQEARKEKSKKEHLAREEDY
jgi:translation initiation factor 3 subunit E